MRVLDDATIPGSPGWWLLRLGKQLTLERPRFDRLEAYHRGRHPLPYGNRRMREAYRRLQRQARSNYVGLVAETVLERMKVTGFRSGGASTGAVPELPLNGSMPPAAGDAMPMSDVADNVDQDAWTWWQANRMDANSGLVHRAAIVMSRAYVMVGNKNGQPLVTGEDPRQVIHESDPEDRYLIRAALKVWSDDVANVALAIVYLPDTIHYYRSQKPLNSLRQAWKPATWDIDIDNAFAPDGVADNDFGEVPVVPFINRPDLAGNGQGEFEDVLDIQDRINTTTLDLCVISAMQAYRQRWAKGVDIQDKDGKPQTLFDPGSDLLWVVPDDNAQFGEFNPVDLSSLIKSIDSSIQSIAAITRCPPQYMIGQIVNVSGDALAASELGLISKVGEREQEFGESWEAVYRLAGKVLGVDVPVDAEVMWRDPQFRTLTEMASASVQLQAAGVPWRTRMEMLDKSPQQIERMETQRIQDAAVTAMLAPPPPPPPPVVQDAGPAMVPAIPEVAS